MVKVVSIEFIRYYFDDYETQGVGCSQDYVGVAFDPKS
jgi:hypothetical protein